MAVRPRSIFTKGLLLVALPVVFQIVTATVVFIVNQRAERAARQVQTSVEVLRRAEHVSEITIQGHSALRGVALFRDPRFEERPRARLRDLLERIGELDTILLDPGQSQRLQSLAAAVQRYLQWVDELEAHARAEDWFQVEDEFRTMTGKRLVDEVLASIDDFLEAQQALDRRRSEAATSQRAAVQRWLLLFTAGLIPLATAVAWVFSKDIAGRVQMVSSNAQLLAEARPLTRAVAGGDEIAALDQVLHATAQRLAENLERERQDARELARRAEELAALNRTLETRTRENEIFVYSASHDLRSPLVNLQGFTQEIAHGCRALQTLLARPDVPPALRADLDRVVQEDITGSLGYIQAAVMRLSAIIDALLRLSRAGRLEYARIPVDLNPIVERILRALGDSVTQKGAEVSVEPLPEVLGDPTAIEQVLANLLTNAVTYLDPARPGRIQVGTANATAPETRTVFVRDNGLGIPRAHQSKLFLPFQRLHESVAAGEGVGLALAWRIVERLGGRMWVESAEREGSTFYVSLPAAAPATPRGGKVGS